MNEITYFGRWDIIDKNFSKWFSCQEWKIQQKYLSKKIKIEFNISTNDIIEIFNIFNEIYPNGDGYNFDWDKYQLPTLIGITARYVNIEE